MYSIITIVPAMGGPLVRGLVVAHHPLRIAIVLVCIIAGTAASWAQAPSPAEQEALLAAVEEELALEEEQAALLRYHMAGWRPGALWYAAEALYPGLSDEQIEALTTYPAAPAAMVLSAAHRDGEEPRAQIEWRGDSIAVRGRLASSLDALVSDAPEVRRASALAARLLGVERHESEGEVRRRRHAVVARSVRAVVLDLSYEQTIAYEAEDELALMGAFAVRGTLALPRTLEATLTPDQRGVAAVHYGLAARLRPHQH